MIGKNKLTISFVLSWLVGVWFFVMGLVNIFDRNNISAGVILILLSIIIIPPVNQVIRKKIETIRQKTFISKIENNYKRNNQTRRYKIIGGSFGLNGELIVNKDKFNVSSAQKLVFDRSHVQDIVMQNKGSAKRYSILSVFIGLILTLILTVFFNIIGLVLGVFLTVIGSRYTVKNPDTATILLKDGKKIEVTGRIDQLLATAQ